MDPDILNRELIEMDNLFKLLKIKLLQVQVEQNKLKFQQLDLEVQMENTARKMATLSSQIQRYQKGKNCIRQRPISDDRF